MLEAAPEGVLPCPRFKDRLALKGGNNNVKIASDSSHLGETILSQVCRDEADFPHTHCLYRFIVEDHI